MAIIIILSIVEFIERHFMDRHSNQVGSGFNHINGVYHCQDL